MRPVVIGKTFQGRDIEGVEIANNVKADDGRPTFFLMGAAPRARVAVGGGRHGVRDDARRRAATPRVATLRANERTVIVPVVNVDGFVSTRQDSARRPQRQQPGRPGPATSTSVEAVAPPGGILAYRRKNCDGEFPNPNVPCELQYGIDNNRNYGNLWGGPGSSQDPTSQSFHGPGPRSEPETQAVWNYARTHQVTCLITLHNVAALVLRPPGLHDGGKAPDEARDEGASATRWPPPPATRRSTASSSTTRPARPRTTRTPRRAATATRSRSARRTACSTCPTSRASSTSGSTATPRPAPAACARRCCIAGEAAADPADHAVISGTAPAGRDAPPARRPSTPRRARGARWASIPVVTVTELPEPLSCPGGVQDPQTLQRHARLDHGRAGAPARSRGTSTSPRGRSSAAARSSAKLDDTPSREDTFTGGGPDPQNNTPTSGSEDREFTITPEDQRRRRQDRRQLAHARGLRPRGLPQERRRLADLDGHVGQQPRARPSRSSSPATRPRPARTCCAWSTSRPRSGTWTAKVGRYRTTRQHASR